MKHRWIFAIALAIIVTVFAVSGAFANNGPHGGYGATTDACAGCHRAHTAAGPKLLVAASTWALCISCHGSGVTGASTNVVDGVYAANISGGGPYTYTNAARAGTGNGTQGAPLLGGGFTYYQNQNTTNPTAVTSIHNADNTTAAAWGNGAVRGVTTNLSGGALTCASCHDPHGSPNYRILKSTINGVAVSVVSQVASGTQNYTNESWPATGMSNVCAACHGAYHKTLAGQGSALDNGNYTHRIDMAYNYGGNVDPEATGFGGYNLPLAGTNVVVCSTCHLSHGTAATMSGFANSGALPGNTSTTDSALLRHANRGVCEVCHQK
jgi:predicted CXXCH cytochrome family protein